MSNTHRFTGPPCVACAYSHKRCPLSCEYAKFFRNVIDRQDYHTIFTVFGVRNVASFLQDVPKDRRLETLNSYLLEATARIENPIRGCTTLLASLKQKVEELQARVTALEARLERGSSCVNPLCSFAPPGSSSRFPLSAENNMPTIIPIAMNLPEPAPGSFLRLLISAEEIAPEILPPIVNLIEDGAFLIEVNLPSFQNLSYDQATLDSDYQAALEGFLLQSSLDDFVADFAETTGPDWTALGNICHDFSDSSASDLSNVKILASGPVEQHFLLVKTNSQISLCPSVCQIYYLVLLNNYMESDPLKIAVEAVLVKLHLIKQSVAVGAVIVTKMDGHPKGGGTLSAWIRVLDSSILYPGGLMITSISDGKL
ncbi:hypothetical protein LguiA_009856 [Lonicera macranthoides]